MRTRRRDHLDVPRGNDRRDTTLLEVLTERLLGSMRASDAFAIDPVAPLFAIEHDSMVTFRFGTARAELTSPDRMGSE